MARILVADPDADLRAAIRRALELEGHDVVEVESAVDVKSVLRGPSVDMLVIEGTLPDVSAVELCAELRESGFRGAIVIVSAYNQRERRVALHAGANDYITRPFGLRDLLKTVRRHLKEGS